MDAAKRQKLSTMDSALPAGIKLSAILLVFFFPLTLHAACKEDWIARAVSVQGMVDVRAKDTETWQPIQLQKVYCQGDTIRVQANSRAAMELHNDTILRLNQNSTLKLSSPKQKDSWLDLLRGSLHSISRVPHSLKIKTPWVNAGIDGTEFIVQVDDEKALVGVIEGQVSVFNEYGRLALTGDQTAITYPGKAPVLRLDIRPADSVQWSLYYPSLNVASLKSAENLLQVGQVAAAQDLLEGRDSADALALRSVIAIAANKKQQAITFALQAIQADSSSAAAHLSHSYAMQANFDLPAAKKAAQTAVSKDPQHAIAWARLAELHLSVAELDEGLAAAKRAVELQPELARTQSILGFAYLLQYKTEQAKQSFTRAIELDSADPLARLGNGLATIRKGDLQQGRREIEIAASLDTNNSLIRSYLGKAYYEEKRNKLAADQFSLAKQMDPKDPTPWLYDAYRLQSENRPIEAYYDVQRSIQLNDNRSVYRSKFALDQDMAVRSAGLGDIYRNIGFDRKALLQGWLSVNNNPLDYSSHRLLADTYSSQARHEFARVNEFFLAQVLQPVNLAPLNAESGEIGLGILKGTGPSESSINEFNSLFSVDGTSFQAQMVGGSNNTYSTNMTLSGLDKNSSYSVGAYHYHTDGFRENNDQKIDVVTQFIQTKISNDSSVSIETRRTDIERGDLQLNANGTFLPKQRQFETVESVRTNFRKDFNPNSVMLFSIGYRKSDLFTQINPGSLEVGTEADYRIADLGYIHVQDSYNLRTGVSYINNKGQNIFFIMGSPSKANFDTSYYNAYAYLNLEASNNLLLSLGASYDSLSDALQSKDKNMLLPKLGLIWSPTKDTVVRGAYFQTLQKPRVSTFTSAPSLEPSQVAGFNQRYLALEGEEGEIWGVGVDHAFNSDYSVGVEFSKRVTNRPILQFTTPPTVVEPDWQEKIFKLYLHGIINDNLTFVAEYLHEKYDRDVSSGITGLEKFVRLNTKRIPLTFNYFIGSKYKVSFVNTYVKQKGDFVGPGFVTSPLSDDFWVSDIAFNYNLPKKRGVITLDIKNLADKEFIYQETDLTTPTIIPERYVGVRLNLAFD